MCGAERPQGSLADAKARCLGQRGGEFGRGPRGAVQATACRAVLAPGQNRRDHGRWNAGRASWSPPDREPVEALGLRGLEPAWQRPCPDRQVFRDVVRVPAAVGHQDGLAAVAPSAVWGGVDGGFQATTFVCTQERFEPRFALPDDGSGGEQTPADNATCRLYSKRLR